ncbi:DUF3592 domain-containing protein [Thalassotalea agariperforans]
MSSIGWPIVKGKIITSESDYYVNPSSRNGYIPTVRYKYTVDQMDYESERIDFSLNQSAGNKEYSKSFTKKYRVGSSVEVRYNPNSPGLSTLETGIDLYHFYGVMGMCILMLGITFYFT